MSSRQLRRLTAAVNEKEQSDSEGEYEPPCVSSTVEAAFKDLLVSSDLEENSLDNTESFTIPRRVRPRKKNRKNKRKIPQIEAAALPSDDDDDDDDETDQMADEIDDEAVDDIPDDLSFIDTASDDGISSPGLPDLMEAQLPIQGASVPDEATNASSSTFSLTTLTNTSAWLSNMSPTLSSLTLDTTESSSELSLLNNIAFDACEDPEADYVFSVSMRKMRITRDIRLFFGADENEGNARIRKWSGRDRIRRKAILVDVPRESLGPTNNGLSMSIQFTQDGYKYFAFEHTPEHQKLHKEFLEQIISGGSRVVLNLEVAKLNTHVESLLEIFDTMCRREEIQSANKLIEHVIAILQYAAHPGFHLCDRRIRLPYKYIENRPYHIAMLKYIYMLSNKACHRTALELAKVLYNLDPSDSIGLIMIMDTLAIKAREYHWVLDLMSLWYESRNAQFLFNMLYSHALAYFHVIKKNNNEDEMIQANKNLQDAILRFPSVVVAILQNMEYGPGRDLINHPYYSRFAVRITEKNLRQLIRVYATLNWQRWQEAPVLDWFMKNAVNMARRFDNDIGMQVASKNVTDTSTKMYHRLPPSILRHMCIIRPMSHLLLDGLEVPHVTGYLVFDPLPPEEEFDRFGYSLRSKEEEAGSSWYALTSFFTSMLPSYNPAA